VDALLAAESASAHIAGDVPYFEACLPIEELARRGRENAALRAYEAHGVERPEDRAPSLRCGPVAPENLRAESYNLVGFQNHMRFSEQARCCA